VVQVNDAVYLIEVYGVLLGNISLGVLGIETFEQWFHYSGKVFRILRTAVTSKYFEYVTNAMRERREYVVGICVYLCMFFEFSNNYV